MVSENVAAEKVDAMKRFERKRGFLKFLPAIEAVVAVLLLVYWLTSTLFAGEYLRRIISGGFTGTGIYIFGVVNLLIALIFSLSNHQKLIEPDLYFQYVSSSAASPVGGLSSSAAYSVGGFSSSAMVSKSLASDNEEKSSEGKGCTSVTQTAGEARPMKREMVRAASSVAETAHAIRRKREMTFLPPATTESSASEHHIYRRSRSERLDVRGGSHDRSMRRLCDIDDLSSDEFRSTVETFIAGKKKMLSKEWMKP